MSFNFVADAGHEVWGSPYVFCVCYRARLNDISSGLIRFGLGTVLILDSVSSCVVLGRKGHRSRSRDYGQIPLRYPGRIADLVADPISDLSQTGSSYLDM